MNSASILSHNHDIHMHSREFSDGSHSVLEVAPFAARWQDAPSWVGLSDHSPLTNERVQYYIGNLRDFQKKLATQNGITLLAGMELEWTENGLAGEEELYLAGLDYVLAAYHGMKFTSADQVEIFFNHAASHRFSDVSAHPDRFLGRVDVSSIHWEKVFNNFKSKGVACEYNLTTPLHPEIFEIAARRSDVNFIIGSDTHDFQNIGVTRVINAWSESLGGRFELAFDYLTNILRNKCSSKQVGVLSKLFETQQLLDNLQRRLFLHALDNLDDNSFFSEEESRLVNILNSIPEGTLDKDFLQGRLDRFRNVSAERILSLLPVEDFKNILNIERQKRLK